MRSPKSRFMVASLLVCSSFSHYSVADWFFRGTPNAWAATPLTQTAGGFETCQSFTGGDASGGPRFKIDRFGNWAENYPTADYQVSANSSYKITFNPTTKQIVTQVVGNCSEAGVSKLFPSLYFRGTANS